MLLNLGIFRSRLGFNVGATVSRLIDLALFFVRAYGGIFNFSFQKGPHPKRRGQVVQHYRCHESPWSTKQDEPRAFLHRLILVDWLAAFGYASVIEYQIFSQVPTALN